MKTDMKLTPGNLQILNNRYKTPFCDHRTYSARRRASGSYSSKVLMNMLHVKHIYHPSSFSEDAFIFKI